MNTTPRVTPFLDEMTQNIGEGNDLMAAMVRANVHSQTKAHMPPAEVWAWYVRDVTYRFVQIEQQVVHDPDGENADGMQLLEAALTELSLTIHVCAKHQQLGLQSFVQGVLKTRMLYLPTDFDASYGGAI